MTGRTVIIGDVHGCARELEALVAELALTTEDRVLFLGDLVNKGPDSAGVLDCFWRLQAHSLLGNHELRLRRQADGDLPRARNWKRLRDTLGSRFDTFIDAIRSWKPFQRLDVCMAVHAGLVPGQAPEESDEADLVTIRTWDGRGADLQDPANPPWFEVAEIDQLVVFGHWAALGGIERKQVIGLDTGCVYGGSLTGLILPSRQRVAIEAREVYCPI